MRMNCSASNTSRANVKNGSVEATYDYFLMDRNSSQTVRSVAIIEDHINQSSCIPKLEAENKFAQMLRKPKSFQNSVRKCSLRSRVQVLKNSKELRNRKVYGRSWRSHQEEEVQSK